MRTEPRPSGVTVVQITGTPGELVSASPGRTSLLISATTADIWVSDRNTLAVGEGVRCSVALDPVELCACHQGSFVNKQLFARTAGGTATVFIIEGFEELWAELATHTF